MPNQQKHIDPKPFHYMLHLTREFSLARRLFNPFHAMSEKYRLEACPSYLHTF